MLPSRNVGNDEPAGQDFAARRDFGCTRYDKVGAGFGTPRRAGVRLAAKVQPGRLDLLLQKHRTVNYESNEILHQIAVCLQA